MRIFSIFTGLLEIGTVIQLRKEIQAIDEALHRIDAGEYGRCQDCDRWITRPARNNALCGSLPRLPEQMGDH
jgi:RNA polymerase-binding transcription factor DksA